MTEPIVNSPARTRAESVSHAALLIDFDNVTMGVRSDLQHQLRNLLTSDVFNGKISVQRAYADWRRYPQYIVPLSEASIDLIFAPAFGANKKNATDIRLAIDALELVFTRPEIGTFILFSGDSDFSSLVLKLKEYGKYVIGVGILESSSDHLVQNCDEYYGYSDLTGFTKAGQTVNQERDPWELVVEAVLRMKESGDVMRSDRLKQVMKDIDGHFDEKHSGFNRFSKFVVEAGKRGLLKLSKMENGQYGIDIGEDANTPPPFAAESKPGAAQVTQPGQAKKELTLADGFRLLLRTLTVLDNDGGSDGHKASAVRDKMVDLVPDGISVFAGAKFNRFLRQANDAEVVEVVKKGRAAYLVKSLPDADHTSRSHDRSNGKKGKPRSSRAKSPTVKRNNKESARVRDTIGSEKKSSVMKKSNQKKVKKTATKGKSGRRGVVNKKTSKTKATKA